MFMNPVPVSTNSPLTAGIPRTVLVIDDEEMIRELLQSYLEDISGWQVLASSSGQEGLDLALSAQPDAIILDMMMPYMSGLTFLCYLQSTPGIANIPVVILTAKGEFADPLYWKSLGVIGAIMKPFEPLLLIQQLTTYLGW
jgi:CheY-like chemotaxis protein